jgi:hypothetical protein
MKKPVVLTSDKSITVMKTRCIAVLSEKTSLTKHEEKKLERAIEAWLVMRIKECGLDERKLNPQACKGIPDRLVFDPKGRYQVQFVELKRNFQAKASPMQIYLAKGLNTKFIHSKEEVEMFLWNYFTQCYTKHQTKEK